MFVTSTGKNQPKRERKKGPPGGDTGGKIWSASEVAPIRYEGYERVKAVIRRKKLLAMDQKSSRRGKGARGAGEMVFSSTGPPVNNGQVKGLPR